jgi:deoxycytidylate deaminase
MVEPRQKRAIDSWFFAAATNLESRIPDPGARVAASILTADCL